MSINRMNRETEDNLSWFHASLSRGDAEISLKRAGTNDGVFLVRESNTSPGDYVLSVLYNGEVWHYQIRRHGEDAFFSIDDQTPIHGLDSLVEHYQKASHGLITKLSAMVKSSPPPADSRSHGRNNLLHRATQENHLILVSELLQCGYRNFDAKNEKGQTAVHLACHSERKTIDEEKISEQILERLIISGANVNCRDKDGNTPLHYACRFNSVTKIKILVDAKANLQSRNNDTGFVPLHEAAFNGSFDAVRQLLDLNAPYLARTVGGQTPAQLAHERNHSAIASYLESYMPPTPTTSEYLWYHGTLDRNESNQILLKYAKKLKENIHAAQCTSDTMESNTSGVFLVRYSKREGNNILTLLDRDVVKNFIIQKHLEYLYIDEGPYMHSLEHLVQHYMMFSDGLPTNLRYPVKPEPKPPLPLFSTIPKKEDRRNKFLNERDLADQSKVCTEMRSGLSKLDIQQTQRNLSIPSDDLMNQVGISNETNINKKKSPGKSTDILNFRSLKLSSNRKKNLIDGVKSLKLSKNNKSVGKPKAIDINVDCLAKSQVHDEISQSFKNLTFSIDSNNLYNVPTNNSSILSDDSQCLLNSSNVINDSASVIDDNFFTKSDDQTNDIVECKNSEHEDQENNKLMEEIYFIDAPMKEMPTASSSPSFNYVAFKTPFFPSSNQSTEPDVAFNMNFTHPEKSLIENESFISYNDDLTHTQTGPNYYIPPTSINLNNILGEGEFGSVYKGVLRLTGSNGNGTSESIPVAIKTLHDEHCQENRVEFLREASVMIKLSHHCIVKLIGISKGPPLMIIQELVSFGSLLNYLVDNTDKIRPNFELKIWAAQIACGMKYLESQHFVHRDLAARNILLASIHQVKISDFGLSRALCANNNYYQASQGGKWPIKWYAPESFNFGTFSHASDVWSFGVTLWEMYSYGLSPYGDMKGVDVIRIIEEGIRLAKPDVCPEHVFQIICDCWNYSPKDRPTFRHLLEFFSSDPDYQNLIELIKTQNIE